MHPQVRYQLAGLWQPLRSQPLVVGSKILPAHSHAARWSESAAGGGAQQGAGTRASAAGRGRRVLLLHRRRSPGFVQDLEAVDATWLGRPGAWKCAPKCSFATPWRHCEVHLGRAPGSLVAPQSCHTGGRRRCLPWTCTPRSWRLCQAGSGRRRGALGPESSVGAHNVPRVCRQGQGAAVHAYSRGVRGQDHAAAVRGAQDLSYGGYHLVGPSVVRKRTAICSAEAASVTPSLPARRPSTCAVVVAEQRGCDARGRCRVLVCCQTVGHQRRGDLVGCEHVLVRARPVGQQRACDGGLCLLVLRARRAVVFQQRVYL